MVRAVATSSSVVKALVVAGALALALVSAGVVAGGRGEAAGPATPHASSTWARLALDPAVYGSGAVSGTLTELSASGDQEKDWDITTGPGSAISPNVPSSTGTAEVNTTTNPSSARARADGAFTELLVPQPTGTTGPAQVINQYGTPEANGLTAILSVSTWQNSVNCTYPNEPIFLTSAVAVSVLGQAVTVSPQRTTDTFDLTGDFGPGTSGVQVSVTSQQLQEVAGLMGHAELDLSATAQLLDEAGQPTGDTVSLFDLVLGDVRMDCSPASPSPSPTTTATMTPSESPSDSPTTSASPSASASDSPSSAPSTSGSPSGSPPPSGTPSGSPSVPVPPGTGSAGPGGPAASGPGPALPITGTSLPILFGVALGCIGLAVTLLVAARRRRS
ncbi:hypothetical protein [Actinocatenispora rupis]|uniref:hypothetical protein n=1 Tax=Actinocatenispora rupis TaxID=519421 RepID=UPI0031E8C1D3